MIVRTLDQTEQAKLSELHAFLLDETRRPGEPEDLDTRLKERLLLAREMPEHRAALELLGDL